MACALCGDDACRCATSAPSFARSSGSQPAPGRWREEVASRVEGYRTKRSKKRLSGEFSMKFDFEPRVYASAEPEPEPQPEFAPTVSAPIEDFTEVSLDTGAVAAAELAIVEDPYAVEDPIAQRRPPRRAGRASVLEFPRLAILPEPEDPNALAEPVFDRPRIVEVPEEVPAEPLPESMHLARALEEDEPPAPAFELPLQVAPIPQRFSAALLDVVLVLAATALFAVIVMRFCPVIPRTKPVLGAAVTVPVAFWALYHYLFLVYAAITPGMALTRIRLSTFEDRPASRSVRRLRALMLLVSAMSLTLGFFWALVDEDTLCWHDKISRTYLTSA